MPNENYLCGIPSDIYKCGGIAPVKATDAMTQPVGQRNGKLFTTPGSEIPDPSDLPDGKILTTYGGEWIADDAPDPLPSPGASGNVLTSTGATWVSAAPVNELPTVTAANNGQVLMVVSGAWAAATIPDAEGVNY